MSGESDTGTKQILREARTHRNKAIRLDSYSDDGGPITWFVAYRGNFGWSACRGDGEWLDDPTEGAVEWAIEEGFDEVELVDLSKTPEEVDL